ncbi:serine/threonine-protein kinase RsbT [Catenulispora sp. GP43]|uniref:ATP-binding protein n=1 Tax=Catenulispora sp. GP43 TaxID=3156263 RepID=UPI003511A372
MTAPGRGPAAEQAAVLAVATSDDVVRARQQARALAVHCGLSLVDQTKLVTAASELARNTVIHGGGGTMHAEVIERGGRRGIRLRFADEGPGVPDIGLALSDGWSSGSGMGLGLSGARRLVDEFDLHTVVGEGTTVTVLKWAR